MDGGFTPQMQKQSDYLLRFIKGLQICQHNLFFNAKGYINWDFQLLSKRVRLAFLNKAFCVFPRIIFSTLKNKPVSWLMYCSMLLNYSLKQ